MLPSKIYLSCDSLLPAPWLQLGCYWSESIPYLPGGAKQRKMQQMPYWSSPLVLQLSISNSQNSKLSRARIFFILVCVVSDTMQSKSLMCAVLKTNTLPFFFSVINRMRQTWRRWSPISTGNAEEMAQRNILWSSAPDFVGSINDLLQTSLSSCMQVQDQHQRKRNHS